MRQVTSKQWGYILLATSVAVNSWAWFQLGLVEMIFPWIPLEVFVYYVAISTNRLIILPKVAVFLLSTFLTFIGLQQYITSDDVKMSNSTKVVDASAVQMKIIKARMDVVEKQQMYESIDPVYIRTKSELSATLSKLQNQSVKYKGKVQSEGLWVISGNCNTRTSKQRNITKRFSVSCGKIKSTRSALTTLRQSYNSDLRRQQETANLAVSYQSFSGGLIEDSDKNIKKLAMKTITMLAPVIGIENVEQRASVIADTSLVLLALLVAIVLSGTVLVVGTSDPKKIKDVSFLTETALKVGGGIEEVVRTATEKFPFATVRSSTVLRRVKLPSNLGVKSTAGSAYTKHLAKTLRNFSQDGVVTRNWIKSTCGCGSAIASAVFITLKENDLLTEDSKWKLPSSSQLLLSRGV